MLRKLLHHLRRWFYHRTHRLLPALDGGLASCGQDVLVHALLGHKREGVFVDIGANDGVTISNTLLFEKNFGWTGLAIEPIPAVYEKLKANRHCHTVHGCITPAPGMAKFIEVVGGPDMLSTLALHNTGLTARRLRKNAKRQGATLREIDVECFRLDALAAQFGLTAIDFLSVDTEGGELEILKSIDFGKLPVRVISVENNYYTPDIRAYLERQGFLYLGTFRVDEIYLYGGDALRAQMAPAAPQRTANSGR